MYPFAYSRASQTETEPLLYWYVIGGSRVIDVFLSEDLNAILRSLREMLAICEDANYLDPGSESYFGFGELDRYSDPADFLRLAREAEMIFLREGDDEREASLDEFRNLLRDRLGLVVTDSEYDEIAL